MNLIEKIYEEMSTDSDGNDKQAQILQNEYTEATVDQQKAIDRVFILRRRKPRPLGVVRDKRLCLTKVLGLKALGHCLGTNSSKTGRAAVAALIS